MSGVDDCSWCYTGDEIESELESVEKEAELRKINRFWMKNDPTQEAQVTFVDDTLALGHKPALAVYEHQVPVNGSYKNWFTCLGKGKCPLCKAGDKKGGWAYYAGIFTVIDHRVWTNSKTGKEHKDELKLFVAKTNVLRIMQRISKKRDGLRGAVIDIVRSGDKSPNVGSNFEFARKVELNSDVQPFNYKEIFKPRSVEILMGIVGVSFDDEGEEIPF